MAPPARGVIAAGVVVLLALVAPAGAQAPLAPPPPAAPPAQFCVADDGVMVQCRDPTNGAPLAPTSFSGYEIEVLRKASKIVGWVEGREYEFKCLPSLDDVLADLLAPNGTCALGAGGITVSEARVLSGLEFTWPSLHSTLGAMLYARPGAVSDGWYFLDAFSTGLWLAAIGTLLVVPVVAFLLEYLAVQGAFRRADLYPGMKEATWRSFWTITEFEPFNVTSTSARVMAVAYGFMALVLVELFQAQITASLTVRSVQVPVSSVDQLVGRSVATLAVYEQPVINAYGLQPAVWPRYEGRRTLLEWATLLRAGALTAVLDDLPFLESYAATAPNCDVALLPAAKVPIDYAPAFRPGTDAGLVDRFSQAVVILQEEGTLTALRDSFVSIPNPVCAQQLGSISAISFKDIYGAWVILGGGLVAATALLAWKRFRKRRAAAARGAAAAPPSPPLHWGDDDDDDDDGDDGSGSERPAETRVTVLKGAAPLRSANYRAGVAFRQRVSMFGMQLARNKNIIAAEEQQQAARRARAAGAPAAAAGGDGSAAGAAAAAAEAEAPVNVAPGLSPHQDPVQYLRHICATIPALAATTSRVARGRSSLSDGAGTYTVDDLANEAPLVADNAAAWGQSKRQYSTIDNRAEEAHFSRADKDG